MNETWRLFIAIELPDHVLKTITQVQADLKRAIPERAVRWTRPEGIHLTLKFLGDVRISQIEEIKTALAQATVGHAAFELGIQGLGCFPNLARPRVLWVGVTGDTKSLRTLQAGVEHTISPLGFPAEDRGFSPHLTLARAARSASRDDAVLVGKIVQERDVGQLVSWQVGSVSLMRSQLKPNGAQYTQVTEVRLEGQ
jgi:2'-5' RNA ligase